MKKTKGLLFWKQKFFSICSIHRIYKKQCNLCNTGTWRNVWAWRFSQLVFKIAPDFWIRWNAKPAMIPTPFSPPSEQKKLSDEQEIILYFETLFGDDVNISQVESFNQLQEYCDYHKYTKEFVLNTIKNKK